MHKPANNNDDWDRLVDALFEADHQNPYLGQTIDMKHKRNKAVVIKKTVKNKEK